MFGISFLNPILLWGALASSLPLLFHLLKRQRFQDLPFSGLIFTSPTLRRQLRASRLTHLLLLLLRIALVCCISLAVAGPRLGGFSFSTQAVSWCLVFDQSASMSVRIDESTVFERARQSALSLIESMGARDRVTLIGAAREPITYLVDAPGGKSRASEIVQQLEPTSMGGRLDSVLQEARLTLSESDAPQRRLVVFTDGQEPVSPDRSVDTRWISVAAPSIANLYIERLQLPRLLGEQSSRRISAFVSNGGTTRAQGSARLNVGGAYLGDKAVDLEPGATAEIRFDVSLGPGLQFGFVELSGDQLAPDNRRDFVLGLEPSIPVLLVGSPEARRYVETALRLEEDSSSRLKFELSLASTLPEAEPLAKGAKMAVICGLPSFGDREKQSLLELRRQGLPVLLFLGPDTMPSLVNETLGSGSSLPFHLGGLQSGSWSARSVAPRQEQLPQPEILDRLLEKVEFRQRHRIVALGESARAWLEFSDGEPLWLELRGQGPPWLFALSGADRASGSFVLSPYFVLLLRRAVESLAQSGDLKSLEVGASPPAEPGWRWASLDQPPPGDRLLVSGLLLHHGGAGSLDRSIDVVVPRSESIFRPTSGSSAPSQPIAASPNPSVSLAFPLALVAVLLFVAESALTVHLTRKEATVQ